MLNADQKEKLRVLLENEKNQLRSHIKELEHPVDFEQEPGPDDETDEAVAFGNRTAAAGDLRQRLADVDDALMRIEKGTYGICRSSGKEIPFEALMINPALAYHPDIVREEKSET